MRKVVECIERNKGTWVAVNGTIFLGQPVVARDQEADHSVDAEDTLKTSLFSSSYSISVIENF